MDMTKEMVGQLDSLKKKLKGEQRKLSIRRFFSNKLIVLGSTIFTILVFIAIFGPLLTPYDPNHMEVTEKLNKPSAEHLLGTDNFGRDLLTRIIYGTRISIGIGLSTAIITSIAGMTIGLISSYFRSLDNILMRIMDGLMAFPSVLLAISLMAALGAKTTNVVLALSIVFTPLVARVVRSAALVVKEETYIEAIRAQGASNIRIILFHIAPNVIAPMVIQSTFIFADAIIIEASLSFLGAGVPPPNPSWGSILYEGKHYIVNAWWMIVSSGVMIIISVLGLNLLGDGLRDYLDPHIKHGKKK